MNDRDWVESEHAGSTAPIALSLDALRSFQRSPEGMMPALHLLVGLLAAFVAGVAAAITLHKRHTVAVEKALYPEVNSMRLQAAIFAGELARRHLAGVPLDAAFFSSWRLSAPLIYPAAGARLGFLSRDALDRVGYFHAQLAEARLRVADAKALGAEALSTYRLLSNLLRAYNHVEPWVASKGGRLGNLLGAEAELGEASRLLEHLEATADEPLALAYCWADACDPSDPVECDRR